MHIRSQKTHCICLCLTASVVVVHLIRLHQFTRTAETIVTDDLNEGLFVTNCKLLLTPSPLLFAKKQPQTNVDLPPNLTVRRSYSARYSSPFLLLTYNPRLPLYLTFNCVTKYRRRCILRVTGFSISIPLCGIGKTKVASSLTTAFINEQPTAVERADSPKLPTTRQPRVYIGGGYEPTRML